MSHTTTARSKAPNTAPVLEASIDVRDFIAAMPIVIFANALRAAFGRSRARSTLTLQTR